MGRAVGDAAAEGLCRGWGLMKTCLAVVLSLIVWLHAPEPAAAQAAAESAMLTSRSSAAASQRQRNRTSVRRTARGTPSPAAHLPTRNSEPTEVANRRALEESAGEDAAVLVLQSSPDEAQVWIEGKYVGRTPLLLRLPPGLHQVELRARRMKTLREPVDVLPQETRQLELRLEPRYPTHVKLTNPD
jgi:hypothetical protein